MLGWIKSQQAFTNINASRVIGTLANKSFHEGGPQGWIARNRRISWTPRIHPGAPPTSCCSNTQTMTTAATAAAIHRISKEQQRQRHWPRRARERDRDKSSRVGCCRLCRPPLLSSSSVPPKPTFPLYRSERQSPRVPLPSRSVVSFPARRPAPHLTFRVLSTTVSSRSLSLSLPPAPFPCMSCLTFSPQNHAVRLEHVVPSPLLLPPPHRSFPRHISIRVAKF